MGKKIELNNYDEYVEGKSHTGGCYGFTKIFTPYKDNKYLVKYEATCGCCPYCGDIQCDETCEGEQVVNFDDVLKDVTEFIKLHHNGRDSYIDLDGQCIWDSVPEN